MNGGQLALDLPPGEARRPERRALPRLDLMQFGISIRLMRGEKARFSARHRVWVSDWGRTWWWPRRNEPWQLVPGIETRKANGYVASHWHQWRADRHVLMAAAWHGPRPPGLVVRHLDGDKLNDAPWNLAYGTPAQNHDDAIRHGTQPPRQLSAAQIIGALLTMRAGETNIRCAQRLGVKEELIGQIRRGTRYSRIAPCLPRRAAWKAMQQ